MTLTKKIATLLACGIGIAASTFAQDFPGYRTGNYSGVNGVFFNPANVVDSRFRWDVNLFSISANISNNNAEYKVKDIGDMFKNDSTLMSKFFPASGKPTNALGSIVLNLPSFMFNINSKNSMAVTTRFRTLVNANDIDSKLVNAIRNEDMDLGNGYALQSNTNSRLNLNGWAEVGLTYGHVFIDKGKHFLKAGITPRYVWGVGNDYAQINNLKGTLIEKNGDYYLNSATGTMALGSGGMNIDKNIDLNDMTKVNGKGWGGDIGFVYEYRPDYEKYKNTDGTWMRNKTKYKFKIGAALLDFGKIKFDRNLNSSAGYNIHIPGVMPGFDGYNLSNLQGDNISDIKNSIDETGVPTYFTQNDAEKSATYKVSLPTTVQLDVDYKIVKHFYVNAMGILSTVKNSEKVYNSKYYNSVSVTPRYEGKIFDFYLPLSYNALTKFNAGAGFRVGPVFAGTGSGLTALIDKSKQADVYFGVHVGIQHKAKKVKALPEVAPVVKKVVDTDGDGIPDDQDKCPTVAGLAKYNGCPIPDTDGDGINDEEDKCPTVPGLAKYHGCPIPDTDGDGVNDEEDQCPTVKGLAKYHGCPIPDTDGDGVNDEEDKCPTIAGPKENHGCPVIKKEVIAKVEKAAKNIFFQTGKATLLAKSYASLDNVASVMKADPSLNIDVKGHTDNTGKPEINQKLSQQRADAVKAYLEKKGIDASRITSTGYGDTQPIATNATAAGRQQNRRVEMVLRNY